MRQYIKTIILLVAALAMTVSTQAAGDATATEDDEALALQIALAQTIRKYSSAADTLAKELAVRFQHNPKLLTAIGGAYFQNRDRDNASIYLEKAIAANPKYFKPYVIYGNMYNGDQATGAFKWAKDTAAYYYNKAIECEPKNHEAYIGLAKAYAYDLPDSMKMAKQTLERLHVVDPSYAVNLGIADLYIKVYQDANEITDNLAKCDPYTLSEYHLGQLVANSYAAATSSTTNIFDKCAEYAKIGMERFPNNKKFGCVYARSLSGLGKYEEAIKAGEKYIETMPEDSLISMDMYSMGMANIGVGNVDKGFAYLARIPNMKDDDAKRITPELLSKNIRVLRNVLTAEKKYDVAAAVQKKLETTYPYTDKAEALYDESIIYSAQTKDSTISLSERQQIFQNKLIPLYNNIEEHYPNYANISDMLYNSVDITSNYFDKNMDSGIAKPYLMKLYNYLSKKTSLTSTEEQYMFVTCATLGSLEYRINSNVKQARTWWAKSLKYKPGDAQVTRFLELTGGKTVATTSTTKSKTRSRRK